MNFSVKRFSTGRSFGELAIDSALLLPRTLATRSRAGNYRGEGALRWAFLKNARVKYNGASMKFTLANGEGDFFSIRFNVRARKWDEPYYRK